MDGEVTAEKKIDLEYLNWAHQLVTNRENGEMGTTYPLKTGYWPADIVRVAEGLQRLGERIKHLEGLVGFHD